ncbi:DMT family transporter [Azospirillum sp. ST 5-10]|uniref:DMT family transporter n=1 Tax=unclassified Azospirillum TaxID=2630922 RepID=UPI003F4A785B
MTPPPIHRSMGPHDWARLLVLSVLWGGSFLFVGVAVRELPTLTVVVARVALAALALHLAVLAAGRRMTGDPAAWRAFVGMGLLNNAVPFVLIAWGQHHIASGLASILNATTPLFGVVVAHLLTRDETMTGGRLAGVLVGFAGVVVMMGGTALADLGGADVAAQLAVLGAALSYALAGVYGRRFRAMGVSPLETATGQVTASTLMLLPLMLAVDRPWTLSVPSAAAVAALLALALVSTALAYILFFRILATAGATNILLVTFLIPVTAVALGAAVLGEAVAPRQFAGMALIGLGLAAIDGRAWRALRPRPAG